MDIKALKSQIASVAKKHQLDMVVLFGSQATGKTHPKSDVDIGFTASRSMELKELFGIEIDICKALGREDVEFVNLEKISPTMKKVIGDDGILLYEKFPGSFILFKLYAFKLYVETKFLRDLRYQSLQKFIYGHA